MMIVKMIQNLENKMELQINNLETRIVRVSAERSAVKHMEFPLYVTCFFSLAAFDILSLCLMHVYSLILEDLC